MAGRKLEKLRVAASKAGVFAVSGVLALSLTPVPAFADAGLTTASVPLTTLSDGGSSADSKLLATVDDKGDVVWPDGFWAQTEEQAAAGTFIWKNYIKGDNAHYGNYDLVTTFQVKDNVLQSIDIASEGTTFGGKWGMISNKSGSIMGYLPDGVTVDATVETAEDGTITVKPTVAGAEIYGGYKVSSLDLYEIKDGKLSQLQELDDEGNPKTEIDPSDGDLDPVFQSATWDQASGTFSFAKNDNAKVVRLNVTVGDYYTFGKYYSVSNSVGADAIATYEAAAKTDYDAAVNGIGAKNRDAYTTAVYAMMVERELPSWLKTIAAGGQADGELSDIDTISAATKSSDSIKEALNASQGIEYRLSNRSDAVAKLNGDWTKLFTSIADDVKITVDGSEVNAEAEKDVTDKTSVKVNESGQYVIKTGYAGGSVNESMPVSGFYLYSITDKNLTSKSLWDLCTNKTAFVPVKAYMTQNTGDHGVLGAYGGGKDVTDDDSISFVATNDLTPPVITVKDPSITHVVVQYGFGKANNNGYAGLVYDLDALTSGESEATSIAEATITLGGYEKTYDGTEKTPEVTVTIPSGEGGSGATTLTAATDYALAYANNANAGNASVIVRGKGSYSGWTGTTFTIDPADITKATIGEILSMTYTGEALTPDVPVSITLGDTTTSLTQGADYKVAATDNVDAGIGTAVVTGTGNYAGTLPAAEFEISPVVLTSDDVKVTMDSLTSNELVVGGVKPTFTVQRKIETRQGRSTVTSWVDLAAGADYNVVYSGASRAGTATAYVIADGNYSGLLATQTYKVAKGVQVITASAANAKGEIVKAYGSAAFSLGAKTSGDGKLAYKSSDTSVATVSSTGQVTIKKAGKADITISAASTGNYNAAAKTVSLTVNQAAQTITTTVGNSGSVTKTYGNAAFSLGAKTSGDGKLAYKSSDTSVATVSSTGKVTIKKAGKADITVSAAKTTNYKAATKTVKLTVGKAANPLATKNASASLKYSTKAQTVAAAGNYTATAGQGTVTYKVKKQVNSKTSKSVSYFTISNKGVVTAKAKTPKGTYKVTLNVSAAASANYKASATKAPVLTVTVK